MFSEVIYKSFNENKRFYDFFRERENFLEIFKINHPQVADRFQSIGSYVLIFLPSWIFKSIYIFFQFLIGGKKTFFSDPMGR